MQKEQFLSLMFYAQIVTYEMVMFILSLLNQNFFFFSQNFPTHKDKWKLGKNLE